MLLTGMSTEDDLHGAEGSQRPTAVPTMQLWGIDWLLAGSTVALGLGLLAAPVALTPSLSSLYGLHGALEGASTLSRLMMSPWLAPLMGAAPTAVAIYSTVTHMTPWRRRVVLVVALLATLGAAALFVRGLLGPLLAVAGSAS